MVVRTARRAMQAETVDRAVVATDDERIVQACHQHDVETVMTASDHENGTERVAEAGRVLGVREIVNVQGDEPLIEAASIDAMVRGLVADTQALVANAACPLPENEQDNPNVVKAVSDQEGRLMLLSRHPIPFSWDKPVDRWRHLGLYVFCGEALENYIARRQGPLERAERVEMYRFLEYGDAITLVQVPAAPPAVDVPEDVVKIEDYAARHGGWS